MVALDHRDNERGIVFVTDTARNRTRTIMTSDGRAAAAFSDSKRELCSSLGFFFVMLISLLEYNR